MLCAEWFEKQIAAGKGKKANPCLLRYGPGPDGAQCTTCQHLFAKVYGHTYYKCELRKNTHGPATDHRQRWPACGKYAEK
jgi:hypothetical protein